MSRPSTASRIGLGAAVTALLVFTLFPVYWMVSTALDPKAVTRGADVLPSGLSFEHFRYVFKEGNFGTYLLNSALVGLGTIVAAAVLSSSRQSRSPASSSASAPRSSSWC